MLICIFLQKLAYFLYNICSPDNKNVRKYYKETGKVSYL